jgi:hypothetical protein
VEALLTLVEADCCESRRVSFLDDLIDFVSSSFGLVFLLAFFLDSASLGASSSSLESFFFFFFFFLSSAGSLEGK